MPKSRKGSSRGGRAERRITVRGVRREQPDLRKLSRALIQLALQQAAAEAAAEASTKAGKADPEPSEPARD